MSLTAVHWLVAGAAFAILGAGTALVAFQFEQRKLSFALSVVGPAGGCLCAGIVAALLASGTESVPPVVSLPIWTWFSIEKPHALTVGFGLEATAMKASMIAVTGLIAFIALLAGYFRKQKPLSEGVVLATSLLYASGVTFAFAPDLAQALLGWAGISLLASILIHLTRVHIPRTGIDLEQRSASKMEFASKEGNLDRQAITAALTRIERFFHDRVWRGMTLHFPASIAEQLESIESTPVSFQIAATILCGFAVLLTWLVVNV